MKSIPWLEMAAGALILGFLLSLSSCNAPFRKDRSAQLKCYRSFGITKCEHPIKLPGE